MKSNRFFRIISQFSQRESSAPHLAVGALLLMTILYATTMV